MDRLSAKTPYKDGRRLSTTVDTGQCLDRNNTAAAVHAGGEPDPVPTVGSLLEQTPWFLALPQVERDRLLCEAVEQPVAAGAWLFRAGDTPPGWYGVIDGLLKWSSLDAQGRNISLAGLSAGSWFGEASLIRGKPYAYDTSALRASRVVLIPREACERLWSNYIAFNHAVMRHLAERVNLFMGSHTAQFLSSVDGKVARTLASMFHRELHPGTQRHLRISQEEIANLCGISRQRCNVALNRFKKLGLLEIEYGGITVLDLNGLRNFNDSGTDAQLRPWAEI